MELNKTANKLYEAFGIDRLKALVIYNRAEEVIKMRLGKIGLYLDELFKSCTNENERLYATYVFTWFFFGGGSCGMNKAQIEMYRLEFKINETDN